MKPLDRLMEEAGVEGSTGGGAVTPPPAPETPPAPVVAPGGESSPASSVDWVELSKDSQDDGEVTPPAATTAPVTPPPATPSPPPVAATPPETPPLVVETPPAVELPVVAATPPPAVTPPVSISREELQRQIREQRDKTLEELQLLYAVSEKDAPDLVVEPEKVLPKMFAQLHANIMDNVVQHINANFPAMLEASQTAINSQASVVKTFYNAWPELSVKPEFGATVARVLKAYRTANPQATPEQVINEGGVQALVALRLPIPERIMSRHTTGAPASPSAPFAPVPGAGRIPTPPVQPQTNVFAVIAEEDVAEMR